MLVANEAADAILKDTRLHPESPEVREILKGIAEIHVTIASFLSQDNSHVEYIQYIGANLPQNLLQNYASLILECI